MKMTIGNIKRELRTVAPMIAPQSAGLWGDMVCTTLQNIELGWNGGHRMSEGVFNQMHEYGMDKVAHAADRREALRQRQASK